MAPSLQKVFQIREDQRPRIPAVTHVDGSGRLQTVYRHTNPRIPVNPRDYRLIEALRELTGVPILSRTSFNQNEPVVWPLRRRWIASCGPGWSCW